jgi:hypothetical protein
LLRGCVARRIVQLLKAGLVFPDAHSQVILWVCWKD